MHYAAGFLLYTLVFCLPAGAVAFVRLLSGRPSRPLALPGVAWLLGGAVLALGAGQALLAEGPGWLFGPVFVLAAALPPLAPLAFASRRLGRATTNRRALAGLLAGSFLAVPLTLLLGAVVTALAFALVMPLRAAVAGLLDSPGLERLFYSPALAVVLVHMAVVAPVAEELAKPVGALLLARRLRGPAEAFLVGMAGGAGFAIVENMLYEGSGAPLWAAVTALRGAGGVLHPLTAGLVALGWYGVRQGQPGAWGRWLGYYGLAVGLHALWNGGLAVLFSRVGAEYFGAETWRLTVYGLGQPGVVIAFMLLEVAVLWRLLFALTRRLATGSEAEVVVRETAALHLERPRRLALWATLSLAVLVSLGALYGPLLGRYAARLLPG